jgi:hypothetical protein
LRENHNHQNQGEKLPMLSANAFKNLRGFNYTPSTATNDISFWRDYDEALIEKELTYAQRLGLNSARVFLSYVVYEHDKKAVPHNLLLT